MSLRIAVARPNSHALSETFIAAHVRLLDRVQVVLTDGELPTRVDGGSLLLPRDKVRRSLAWLQARTRGKDLRRLLQQRIADLLQAQRIDVMLAEYGNCAHALIGSCERARLPLVAHFFGADAHKDQWLRATGNYAALFKAAAALVVVSRTMEQHLLALGAPAHKVHYIPCGIDIAKFTGADPASAPPHFLAVGRFVEKKAPLNTLKAFAMVVHDQPQARLTMVGDGPLYAECQRFVSDNELSAAVDLCGSRTPEEVLALVRRSRAFVQHSVVAPNHDREGKPVAILEAMAAGLPIVATRHGDISEMVAEDERGLLCDEGDIKGMAAQMIALAADASRAARLGRAASAYAHAHYRQTDRIGDLQRLLEQVAAAR